MRLAGTEAGGALCVESEEAPSRRGSLLVLAPCADYNRQQFHRSSMGEWVLARQLCLQAHHYTPSLAKCHLMRGNQHWTTQQPIRSNEVASDNNIVPNDNKSGDRGTLVYNRATGLCLAAQERRSGAYVTMAMCAAVPNALVEWELVTV